MIFCIIYNIVNIACWCGLAYHTGHWWIAFFAAFTMLQYKTHSDDGGNKNAAD